MKRICSIICLILFLASCKNREMSAELDRIGFVIPKDSCYFQELIGRVDKDRIDTICFIKINLQTWTKQIYVDSSLNIGIAISRILQRRDYGYNVMYEAVKKEDKLKKSIETTKGDGEYYQTYTKQNPGKTIDASAQYLADKDKCIVIGPMLVAKQRLLRVSDMVKESSPYSKIFIHTFISDSKDIKVSSVGAD